jgi:hypothetical protein
MTDTNLYDFEMTGDIPGELGGSVDEDILQLNYERIDDMSFVYSDRKGREYVVKNKELPNPSAPDRKIAETVFTILSNKYREYEENPDEHVLEDKL